jgi:hypothetical protein
MSVTVSDASYEPRSVSIGPVKLQFVEIVAFGGATSGTVTASRLKEIYHILVPGIKSHTAAPTYATNVATLAFTVPAETAATLTLGGVTYTAVANLGAAGNSITVAYTAGAVAGSEVVTVTGNAISVQIANASSTITQVRTAVNASAAAAALVTATGTSATVVSTATATALTGGVAGGFRGSAICLGR